MTKQWTTIDKSEWGEGPWQEEPDKIVWVDEATDLDCMIHRNRIGSLCGYVGVPPTHPWFMKHYDKINADVHGGLTFSNHCQEEATEDDGICHVPEEGREHNIWWLGFDCAHGWDVSPEMETRLSTPTRAATYKNVAYVRSEVESLARQAKEESSE